MAYQKQERDGPGTAFNMGIATLERMNNLLNLASIRALDSDLYKWFTALLDLRRQVYPFLKEETLEKIEKLFKEIPTNSWRKGQEGFFCQPNFFSQVSISLDKINIALLQGMKKEGLLMPKSDDPRFSWAMESG